MSDIFILVCNLEAEPRRRLLDKLCVEFPDLRAEVELLLCFHDRLTDHRKSGEKPQ